MRPPVETVGLLADALDQDDWSGVRSVLSPNVTYDIGAKRLRGPDAVIESYRNASHDAHELFDAVTYSHQTTETERAGVFLVSYIDDLSLGGETLRHVAHQEVTVTEDLVSHIDDVTDPNESERVREFIDRHGTS